MRSQWFDNLRRPRGSPPSWVVGVVWPILYILITISVIVGWRHRAQVSLLRQNITWVLFALQLALNLLWSPIFFRLRRPRVALGIAVALWSVSLATMVMLFFLSPWSCGLWLPYQLWLSLALYVNAGIVLLNA